MTHCSIQCTASSDVLTYIKKQMGESDLEVWQRGPVDGVPALLQPVAHALLQAVEELGKHVARLPKEFLWERPGGVASVGFHLLHISGVVDRLFTYARGEALTPEQINTLNNEKETTVEADAKMLIERIRVQVDKALDQLRATPASSLTDPRALGRKQIPTTVIGLLFHAAEHTQRHVGQLLVTSRILLSP